MASTPPWSTSNDDDGSRFVTTNMAKAAYTPQKNSPTLRRRLPWGVEELRPSTSPERQQRRATATATVEEQALQRLQLALPRRSSRPSRSSFRAQRRTPTTAAAATTATPSSSWSSSKRMSNRQRNTTHQQPQHQQDGVVVARRRAQQPDAFSIHTTTAKGQQRPRRYFSNYVDASKGHT